ncbi:hypothetical protein CTAYLR_008986 [Chrysophaeum taylorii]|uniref:EF-hand domain-containing protein n=1 Tax=Chrysophaeum taylorii TaxID=2483200 RepID=A0AAD7URX9_9STRA|nr:hypothetical protein CTAYLR_008986 [Chrysophaeum taylorii]
MVVESDIMSQRRVSSTPSVALRRASRRLEFNPNDELKVGMLQQTKPKEDEDGFVSEIMLSLDTDKVRMLRLEFERRGPDGLTLPQFCHVMKMCLLGESYSQQQSSQTTSKGARRGSVQQTQSKKNAADAQSRLAAMPDATLVENFCEFFAAVDIDGNGNLDWEEFTSYVVERVMASHDQSPNSIQPYTACDVKEATSRSTSVVKQLHYFQKNDTIVTLDEHSPEFRVYSSKLDLRLTVVRPEGLIVCIDYIPKAKQYVISSTDARLSTYDDTTGVLCQMVRSPSPQFCLHWVESQVLLFTSDITGTIRAWDGRTLKERFKILPVIKDFFLRRNRVQNINALAAAVTTDMATHGTASGGSASDTTSNVDGRESSQVMRDESPQATDFRTVLDMIELDGLEMIAAAAMDSLITLWDIQTGKLKRCLPGHAKGVAKLGFSPEYRFLVSGGFDFDVIIWNPYVEHYILRLPGHNNAICGVELISGTPQLITADVGGDIKVWDVRNFSCVQSFSVDKKGKSDDIVTFVSVTSRKQLLAVGRYISTYEYEHTEHPELTDDAPVFAARYNATTMTIMTASMHHVRVWDARNGTLVRVCRGVGEARYELTALCLDRSQRKFVVGDHEGHVCAFNYVNGEELQRYVGADTNTATNTRRDDDDDDDAAGIVFGARNDEMGKAHRNEVSHLIYVNEHGLLLTSSWDGTICVFDDEDDDAALLRVMSGGHEGSDVTALAYSGRLSLVASGSSDGGTALWDFESGRLLAVSDQGAAVTALGFVDPYPAVLVANANGTMHLWATATKARPARCLAAWQAFSPFSGIENARDGIVLCFDLTTNFDPISHRPLHSDNDSSSASSSTTQATTSSDTTRSSSSTEDDEVDSVEEAMSRGDIRRILVVAGDDAGNITLWDIWPLVRFLEETSEGEFARLVCRVPSDNPRRNVRFDTANCASPAVHAPASVTNHGTKRSSRDQLVETTLRIARTYELQSELVLWLKTFVAHSEAITSLQYVEECETIITCGLDRFVRIWSEGGSCLGTLRQGNKVEYHRQRGPTEPWAFRINEEKHSKHKSSRTEEVLSELRELEHAQRAAEAAGKAADPRATVSDLTQLREMDDGQLHFVLTDSQLRSEVPERQSFKKVKPNTDLTEEIKDKKVEKKDSLRRKKKSDEARPEKKKEEEKPPTLPAVSAPTNPLEFLRRKPVEVHGPSDGDAKKNVRESRRLAV